jgi:DNA-binding transcriptional ArsR family regulator
MEVPGKADPALGDSWLSYAKKHPLRARLLALAKERPSTVAELAKALGEPPVVVAYHWRVLKRAGLL